MALSSARDRVKRRDPRYDTIERRIPACGFPDYALGLGPGGMTKMLSLPWTAYMSAASNKALLMLPLAGVAFRREAISALETPT